MALDESGSLEMFNCYNRVASGDEDTDGSDLVEEENELTTEKEADGGLVWWVSGGEGEGEEEEEDEEEEEEDSDWDSDDQPTPTVRKGAKKHKAAGASTQPPRNQQFPANPPQSLSSEAQAEWTLRRDRKSYSIPPTKPPPNIIN